MKSAVMAISLIIGSLFLIDPCLPFHLQKPDGQDTIKVVTCMNGKTTTFDTVLSVPANLDEAFIKGILKNTGTEIALNILDNDSKKTVVNVNKGDFGKNIKIICMKGDPSGVNICCRGGVDSLIMIYEKHGLNTSCLGDISKKHRTISLKSGHEKHGLNTSCLDDKSKKHRTISLKSGHEKHGSNTSCLDDKSKWHRTISVKSAMASSGDITVDPSGSYDIEVNTDGNVTTLKINGIDFSTIDNAKYTGIIKNENGKKIIVIKSICNTKDLDENAKLPACKDVVPNSVEETMKAEQFVCYPNPNNGKFNLNFELPEKVTTHVRIIDIKGNVVYNEIINNFDGKYNKSIDISYNAKGIYFIVIEQGNKTISKKIVFD